MITFNTVLRESGLNPRNVLLVRHQDKRKGAITTPHALWLTNPSEFLRYQRLQSKDRFRAGKTIASFVVNPRGESVFAGLYRVTGQQSAPSGSRCPVSDKDCSDHLFYDIESEPTLGQYVGLLTIDWGEGARAWVQHAYKNEKRIRELRLKQNEDEFPGFTWFCMPLLQLMSVPDKWKDILGHSQGVYVLTCHKTGKQYVGSAKGSQGFWQRFCDYVHTQHGGNVELKGFDMSHMWVSVLQVVHTGTEQIEKIEQAWKVKLQTQIFGLNSN